MKLQTVIAFLCLLIASTTFGSTELDETLLRVSDLGSPPQSENPVRHFNLDLFKHLIDEGANVNAQDMSGGTPLKQISNSIAYFPEGSPDRIKLMEGIVYLLSKGADINITNSDGRSPAFLVIYNGLLGPEYHLPVPDMSDILDLLSSGIHKVDWNQKDILGRTILFWALEFGGAREMRYLLKHGALIDQVDNLGRNLAFVAVSGGLGTTAIKTLEPIIPLGQRQEFFNTRAKSGSTPFLTAVFTNNLEAANYLLDTYKIDVNLKNVEGINATDIIVNRINFPYFFGTRLQAEKDLLARIQKLGGTPSTISNNVFCDSANFEPLTFEKVMAIVSTCKLSQLDELIPLLPKSILATRALFFAGRGFIKGSYSHPVVVAAGREGKTYLAFGGDPNLKGYNNLDMIEFKDSPKGKFFEFRTLEFREGRAHLSVKNPPVCLRCHGSNPRPLFESWFMWPGAYFGEQDFMYPAEKAVYVKEFLPNADKGRYKALPDLADSPIQTPLGEEYFPEFTNTRITDFVEARTSEVMMSQMAHDIRLKKFKYAILGALSCQDSVENFLPPEVLKNEIRKYPDYERETREVLHEETMERINRIKAGIPGAPQGEYISMTYSSPDPLTTDVQDVTRTARLRYLYQFTGVDVDWSNTFSPKLDGRYRYVFHDLINYEVAFWRDLLTQNDSTEGGLRALYQGRFSQLKADGTKNLGLFRGPDFSPLIPGVDSKEVCSKLQAASLKSLSAPEPVPLQAVHSWPVDRSSRIRGH